MRRPARAIVLAAGFGTRMRPISWAVPKPLLPLWNRPLALRILDTLAEWGVHEVLINLHHGANAVFNTLREAVSRERLPLQLVFSFEAAILGTGGALRRASWFFDEGPLWIVNADIALDVSPDPFVREMRRHRPLGVLWLDSRRGPRTVEVHSGRITNFRSPRPGAQDTATFCGLHLVSPEVLRFLPDRPFSSIIEAYNAAIEAGRQVRGVEVPRSFWRDLGTPAQYLEAHAAWSEWTGRRRTPVGLRPFRAIAPTACLAPDTKVENSVVMDGARITAGVDLRNSIVVPGAIVTRSCEGPVVMADLLDVGAPPYARVASALGWNPSATAVNALAPRGSDRSFSRMVCGTRSAILIEHGTTRPENASYARHAKFLLAHGVRVPAVLLDWPDERVLVMEDAGERSLESVVPTAHEPAVERLYRGVLDSVIRLHSIHRREAEAIRDRLQPAFGPAVYKWERGLFARHFLGPRLGLNTRGQTPILAELARVARRLSSAPPVLVHRDLQSSNIFLAGGGPVLIDFQGMRFGPAAYDVASLLCDPYVMLSDGLRSRLLSYYLDRVRNPEHVDSLFWWAAVERLAQALGAFGRLSESPGTVRFEHYIPPALQMMQRVMSHLPAMVHLSGALSVAQEKCQTPRDDLGARRPRVRVAVEKGD